jgi:branched-chain amino acid transport system ATP-binding protein
MNSVPSESTRPGAPPDLLAASRAAAPQAPALLELQSVSKHFGGFAAVSDVSLTFGGKAIYGIIGPNGAGKTTLFNLLSGALKPTRGRMLHRGEDITRLAAPKVSRRGIVRSFQITSIFANLTIGENVALPIQRRDGGGARFWVRNAWRERHGAEIDRLLAEVGIPADWQDRPARALPYGLKRSLELAISLAAKPDILLLDEPTAGMSLHDIERITPLIRSLSAERMVIVVEHNLGVISDLAEEIVVMQQGRVLTRGAYDEVRRDARVIAAYLGTRAAEGHA